MDSSRRAFLASGLAGAGALAGCTTRSASATPWEHVQSNTSSALYDVVVGNDAPYAVGESGLVLRRGGGDQGWQRVVENGPHALQSSLVGAATTDNGGNVWFCGGSGTIGMWNTVTQSMTDYSQPNDITSSWEDVAVVGLAGQEYVYLVNSSGELLVGSNNDGEMTWADAVTKPGGGSTAPAIVFDVHGFGYVADTGGAVYESVNGGRDWRQIGIPNADVALHDISAVATNTIDVAGGTGSLYRFDGFDWSTLRLGEKTLYAVDRTRRDGIVGGESGTVFEFTADGWRASPTPADDTLHGVIIASPSQPALAVGENGTIIERQD
ncbi:sialidase family protein [Halocalculus aciditolerans]|uniref:Photosynthesis system II assembly factor Ycf48/Hcf136-like domain-containing protein n=1 Tax=Halocalculus aciditolerans TaxID=1383812 RepID=A0A830F4F6_9EURY|nr:hypothetical protein [Halocalculus aciditolerans]GGL61693.1 hypothetical protein GCM10009039_19890 [Halocalculus aciditolerans]